MNEEKKLIKEDILTVLRYVFSTYGVVLME